MIFELNMESDQGTSIADLIMDGFFLVAGKWTRDKPRKDVKTNEEKEAEHSSPSTKSRGRKSSRESS